MSNTLTQHVTTAQELGFQVETDEVYERLYHLGENIPLAALAALLPNANDYQLMSITKGGYELELNLWSPDHENDAAMIRVNLRGTLVGGNETEEVDPDVLHDYINVIEAVGIFRLAIEKFENQSSNLARWQRLTPA